jgi:uncharacterized membrane protein AbrB (regulator of aidB expression)
MGLFYTRQSSAASAAGPRLLAAHAGNAKDMNAAAQATQADTQEVAAATRPEFSVPRFVCAAILVVLLAVLWIYVAHDSAMKDAASAMQNLFVTLTSGLIGVLVGEASGSSSQTRTLLAPCATAVGVKLRCLTEFA